MTGRYLSGWNVLHPVSNSDRAYTWQALLTTDVSVTIYCTRHAAALVRFLMLLFTLPVLFLPTWLSHVICTVTFIWQISVSWVLQTQEVGHAFHSYSATVPAVQFFYLFFCGVYIMALYGEFVSSVQGRPAFSHADIVSASCLSRSTQGLDTALIRETGGQVFIAC